MDRKEKKKFLINRLKDRGFSDRLVGAFESVERDLFVPIELRESAYLDVPLPVGQGQTISQPYTIAFMLSLLNVKEGQRILEIGSGSGYVLALLSHLNKTGDIVGIERIDDLVSESKARLRGYSNVSVIHGNALEELGNEKFDRILVSAAFEDIPQNLIKNNLNFGGRFVSPVMDSIIVLDKESGQNKINEYPGFSFVPILGGKA